MTLGSCNPGCNCSLFARGLDPLTRVSPSNAVDGGSKCMWKLEVLHRHWEDDPSPVWIIVILGLLLER